MPSPQAVPSVLVLGQVGVRTPDGVDVAITGHAGRLLCLLVDAYPTGVSRDTLEAGLWGDEAPATSASAFRVHLTKLRRHLDAVGAAVTNRSATLTLEAGAFDLDVELARLLGERAYRRLQESESTSALEDAERALRAVTSDEDLREELRMHVDRDTERLQSMGVPARQAREQACQAADMDTVLRIREMSRQELS